MAKNNEEFIPVGELKARKETPDAVFAGVLAAKGWKDGKAVTEKEYEAAVEAFLKAPVDGRKAPAGRKG